MSTQRFLFSESSSHFNKLIDWLSRKNFLSYSLSLHEHLHCLMLIQRKPTTSEKTHRYSRLKNYLQSKKAKISKCVMQVVSEFRKRVGRRVKVGGMFLKYHILPSRRLIFPEHFISFFMLYSSSKVSRQLRTILFLARIFCFQTTSSASPSDD